MEIKDYLIKQARLNNVCFEGYNIMRSSDINGLVDYYLSAPDWCLERDFPDYDTLLHNFADKVESKGIYINRDVSDIVASDRQVYVFHHCTGTLHVAMDYDKCIIPMIYIANGCDIKVVCEQERNEGMPINVPIYIFGENAVTPLENSFATFKIYNNKILTK